jgi:site-specific recombinase XerD
MDTQTETPYQAPVKIKNPAANKAPTILSIMEPFLDYEYYEENKAKASIIKYRDCLRNTVKRIGDVAVEDIDLVKIVALKKILRNEGLGERRIASLINTLRVFLRYCEEHLELKVLDYHKLKPPKIPRKFPDYLTDVEIMRFLESIKLLNKDGSPHITGLRFRALIELILSTGLRISETLSIRIKEIDFREREIKVRGKGNKERFVYLTGRAVHWLRRYLKERGSDHEYLFVTRNCKKPLPVHDLWRYTQRYRLKAGIDKKVTPHIFRRTFATKLRNNGVDITIVSELLGHADINTTAKYYIGRNRARNKEVHREYLHYELGNS